MFPALALGVSNKEEEDPRVKMNTCSRLPMEGQECQKNTASHRALSGLLRCGVHECVCVCVCVCTPGRVQHRYAFGTQSETESNMGKGLG